MKTRILALTLLNVWMPLLTASSNPELIVTEIRRTYIPIGFDDNDRIELMVSGVLPDTCHKIGPSLVKRHGDGRIFIQQRAYRYKGEVCLRVFVPFHQLVNIGILRKGHHEIIDAKTRRAVGMLPVSPSTTSSPDDYLYAPIIDAGIETAEPGSYFVRLTGKVPTNCLRFQRANVRYHKDVIVLQPILEEIETEGECSEESVPFSSEIPLRLGLRGSYLLHVRSMDGKAINKMVEFDDPH